MFLDNYIEKSHINLLQSSSKVALAYLVSRGITLEEIKKYKIGFSNFYSHDLDEKDSDSLSFNKWLGYKGKFIKNRIVFPIFDEMGNIRGIETRSLDKKACSVLKEKFKLSLKESIDKLPENEIRYKKFYLEKNKHIATFFGLPDSMESIWETKEVFLTEGIFDMLTLKKIKNNCLSPLTANINSYQIEWLKRYVDRIFLLFDMDDKGKESTQKLKKVLEKEIQVIQIPLKGKDVNEFASTYGIKELEYYINNKMDCIF
jgi:DNA primase